MKYKQALNLPMHRPFFINVFLHISLPWGVTARLQPQGGGRYIIGRRENSGRKCREEEENEMLGVGR